MTQDELLEVIKTHTKTFKQRRAILAAAIKYSKSRNSAKPDVVRSVCKCGNHLTEKELYYETCLQCNDVVIAN